MAVRGGIEEQKAGILMLHTHFAESSSAQWTLEVAGIGWAGVVC